MFDIGWTELLVIAVVLIVVVGPKDLPPMLRAFGKTMTRFRKVAGEFRAQFDEALREADLDEVRQHIADAQRLNPANSLREAMNPLRQMGNEIKADLQRSTVVDHPQVSDSQAAVPVPAAPVLDAPALEAPAVTAAQVIAPPPAIVAEQLPAKPKAVRKPRAKSTEKVVEASAVIEPSQVDVPDAVEKPKRVSRKVAAEVVAADSTASVPKKAPVRRGSAEKRAAAVLVEPSQVGLSEAAAKPKRTIVAAAVDEASAVVGEAPAALAKARAPRKSAKKKDDA